MKKYLIILLLYLASCTGNNQQSNTPEEFINHVTVDADRYSADSIAILNDLYIKMKSHQASFGNSEYYDSTLLIIDTLIYDRSFNKMAVFVVARNPVHRNPHSDSKLPYYYNANCYLGKRIKPDSTQFELQCLCRFSEINFNDYSTVIKALEKDFFSELATVLDEKGQPVFRYNVNDKRFWDSSTGWKRVFDEK
jgi:hypothetical protein